MAGFYVDEKEGYSEDCHVTALSIVGGRGGYGGEAAGGRRTSGAENAALHSRKELLPRPACAQRAAKRSHQGRVTSAGSLMLSISLRESLVLRESERRTVEENAGQHQHAVRVVSDDILLRRVQRRLPHLLCAKVGVREAPRARLPHRVPLTTAAFLCSVQEFGRVDL